MRHRLLAPRKPVYLSLPRTPHSKFQTNPMLLRARERPHPVELTALSSSIPCASGKIANWARPQSRFLALQLAARYSGRQVTQLSCKCCPLLWTLPSTVRKRHDLSFACGARSSYQQLPSRPNATYRVFDPFFPQKERENSLEPWATCYTSAINTYSLSSLKLCSASNFYPGGAFQPSLGLLKRKRTHRTLLWRPGMTLF